MYKPVNIDSMGLTRKVAYNTGALIFGRVLNTAISLVIVALLTRYLGVAGYGQYTTVFAFVGIFSTFADFGFMLVLLRELGAGKMPEEKAVANVLSIRTIFALLVYALCFCLGWLMHYPLAVHLGIGVIAIAMFFNSVQGTIIAVLQAKLEAQKAVIGDIVGRVIIFALTYLLFLAHAQLVALLVAYAIGSAVDVAVKSYYANKLIPLRFGYDAKYWRYLWGESWPIGLAGILSIIYFKVDSVMLSVMKTPSDIGIYGAPYKIFEVVLALSALYMGVVFPILSRYYAQKDSTGFENGMQKSFDFMTLLSLPIMAACLAIAPAIIHVVAGESFVVAHTFSIGNVAATTPLVLQILCFTVPLSYLTNLFNNMIIGCGRQKVLLFPNLLFLIFNVGLNLILIPKYSYIGSAVATVLTEVVVLSVNWYLLKRFAQFKISYTVLFKTLLASVMMFLIMYLTRNMNILVPILSGIAVYAALTVLTGAVTKHTIVELVRGKVA